MTATACASCRAPLAPGAKFCSECGERVAGDTTPAHAAAPEGELRTVSVLFADMSGSVATFHGADPETATERVNQVLDAMVSAVTDHGGIVDRFLGDGLLALFGARGATEDDPVRAVTAGLEICRRVRELGAAATAGINTGAVYLGRVGSDRHAETTAMGPVVNLAARLQGQAGPGEVVVSPETARHCGGSFELVERVLTIKGIPEPVTAFAVTGTKARRERRARTSGVRTIGRDAELRQVAAATDALACGDGGVLLIEGDAGLGKSRLVAEARTLASAAATVLEGRCFESSAAPLQPFADALHGHLGWEPATPDTDRLVDVDRLAALGDGGDRMTASALATLVGLRAGADAPEWEGLPAAQRQREIFRAVRLVVEGLAARRPVVLVLEDLHWSDAASIDLAADLFTVAATRPVLVVCVFRPAAEHPVAALEQVAVGRCPRTSHVVLHELDPSSCEAMAAAILGVDRLPDAARAVVVQRAQGNPLFIEEVIRAGVATGWLRTDEDGQWVIERRGADGAYPVPDTLELLVRSRTDRLRPETQRVLQLAALQGRVFSASVLARLEGVAVVDAALAELSAGHLAFPSPDRAPDEWTFTHVLVQETIEQGILRRVRPALHTRLLDALEEVHEGRTEERAGELARHAEAAGDAERALRHLRAAGLNAKAAHANDLAADLLGRALRWVPAADGGGDDDVRAELHEHRGDVLHRSGHHEEAVAELDAALAATTDPVTRARLFRKRAAVATITRDYDDALASFRSAASELGATPSAPGAELTEWLDIRLALAGFHYWRNEPAAIAEIIETVAPVVEEHGTDLQRAEVLQMVMMRRLREGRYRVDDTILDHAVRSARLASTHPDPGVRAFKRFNLAFCRLWARDLDEALIDFAAAVEDGDRAGDVVVLSRCHTYRAVAHRFLLDEAGCESAIADAMETAGHGGMVEYVAAADANRAWLAWRRGDHEAMHLHAGIAISAWETTALVYGFQWTARFPLLAHAFATGDRETVEEQRRCMTTPAQQRLPDSVEVPLLAGDVEAAIEAGTRLGYA